MKMLKFAYLAIESSSSSLRINKLEDAFVRSCSLSNMYKKRKIIKKEGLLKEQADVFIYSRSYMYMC